MSRKPLSRREFLKLAALVPPSIYLSRFFQEPSRPLEPDEKAQNVLVVVFDAFAAKHISLYGYPRNTMPNLAKIAERATVYHNHYAGSNWTAPGTATLLTGTYPWTHRAFNQEATIVKDRVDKSIFSEFDQYYRFGYSHNSIADRFLWQLSGDIEQVKPQKELFVSNDLSLDRYFHRDGDIASLSWDRTFARGEDGYSYSLFLSQLYEKYGQAKIDELLEVFPRGIPYIGEDDYFLLEQGIDWLQALLTDIQQPFLGYLHFLPPHRPYFTRHEYVDAFLSDGFDYGAEKPINLFRGSGDRVDPDYKNNQIQFYDEFILYVDAEFGRLYDFMEAQGLTKNTWIIFTSDHGESFERGIFGHRTPFLYQPVIKIPLLIFEPGQTERRDIYTSTSAVDVLPTLLQITGRKIPDWTEGQVLPPYAEGPSDPERSIYALEATDSPKFNPLNPATVTLIKDQYKLTHLFGYEQLDGTGPLFELYDLENDPEEINNLYASQSEIARELKNELLEKIHEVDQPYT